MRFNILGMIAAVALVAACETAPTKENAATGSGGAKPAGLTEAYESSAPVGPAMGSQEDLVVNVGDRVFFDFDKYNLQAESRRVLEGQAAWLKKYHVLTVVVGGHADERGTRDYNLALGERRAKSVAKYLTTLGVAKSQISMVSYGEEKPMDKSRTERGFSKNRRAVLVY